MDRWTSGRVFQTGWYISLLGGYQIRKPLTKFPFYSTHISKLSIQGDAERELGIPFSPLCDRETTMVSQSQIGFIDFIITPTFNLLCQLFLSINVMLESKAEEILRQHADSDKQDSEEILHKVRPRF